MSDNIAIHVEHVSKDFILPHEKITSVKGLFLSAFRRRKLVRSKQHALRDVSFDIKKGEFFGIVGRNGSGKSTMLKMLAGIYQPSKGRITVEGRLVPFIELGVGFNPELTGRENVYLNGAMMGFSKKETDAMYDEIVAFAELEEFMDQRLKNYSSGMQVRLAFSVAIRAEADVLLVDEVLAVGDADFQRKCYEYFKTLKRNKKTVVFVSHDMGAIREFCTRALLIEDSRVIAEGKASYVASRYSQLFIEDSPEKELRKIETPKEGSRWGNGAVTFANISAKVDGDELIVSSDISAQATAESIIYGLHITGQDGAEITAMNNRMIHRPDIELMKKGEIIRLVWRVLNVFNDGRYYVTMTLVNEAGVTYDWFTDATSFVVRRTDRSTTAVLPPVMVDFESKGSK